MDNLGVVSQMPIPWILRQGLDLAWNSLVRRDWQVCELQESIVSVSPVLGACHYAFLFVVGGVDVEDLIQFFMRVRQTLCN